MKPIMILLAIYFMASVMFGCVRQRSPGVPLGRIALGHGKLVALPHEIPANNEVKRQLYAAYLHGESQDAYVERATREGGIVVIRLNVRSGRVTVIRDFRRDPMSSRKLLTETVDSLELGRIDSGGVFVPLNVWDATDKVQLYLRYRVAGSGETYDLF